VTAGPALSARLLQPPPQNPFPRGKLMKTRLIMLGALLVPAVALAQPYDPAAAPAAPAAPQSPAAPATPQTPQPPQTPQTPMTPPPATTQAPVTVVNPPAPAAV